MPIRKDIAEGVDLNRLAQEGAKKLLARRDEERAIAERAPYAWETSDTIYVLESQLDPEPTIKWQPVSLPFGLPMFNVRASLSEAVRNKQSLRELLERRMRRAYRDHLYEAQILPEAEMKARVMRLQVVTMEAPRIVTPESHAAE